jgi:hypothetical protein
MHARAVCVPTQVLTSKQGGSQQFASQAERDGHLKQHITSLKQAAGGLNETLSQLQQQEEELNSSLNDMAAVSLL